MAKLLENTYRHVNIALVNEMALFCHEMGIDLWDVIALAQDQAVRLPGVLPRAGRRRALHPDRPELPRATRSAPTLGYPFRFVELAQEINQRMPTYVARRLQDKLNRAASRCAGSKVLLLGVTYKPDIADQRESPAVPLAQRLMSMGVELQYHDPSVTGWTVDGIEIAEAGDLADACAAADAVIIVQAHAPYLADPDAITGSGTPVLDATGKFSGENLERL